MNKGKEVLLFLKKKEQKNFYDSRPREFKPLRPRVNKSFLLLFFIKEVFLFSLLTACAPPLPVPDTAVKTGAYLPGPVSDVTMTNAPLPVAWWRDFGSDALNTLVADGVANSPTITQAQASVAAADENAAAANGAFLPQVVLNPPGDDLVSRQSFPTGPNGYPPYTEYEFTGTITYDPGLFGAKKYTFENGAALADYQRAELDAARQTLIGNIVAAAISEAGYAAQIDTTNKIIAAEQKLLTLLNGEYQDGAISQLNVLQQQAQVLAVQATLPPLQTAYGVQRDRLAVLTGRMPGDFGGAGVTLDGFHVPVDVPVALPSTYLAKRPDLRAALAQVAAQNAALGVAVAHLYPDFSLSATGGYAAETVGTLFGTDSALWILAGNLLVPIYEGGQLHAHKVAAQEQLKGAIAAYREAVLEAFGQAADTLQAVQDDQVALARASQAADTAIAAFKLGEAQYSLGANDYTTVLAAQTSAAQQALALVQARTTLLLDIAKLQNVMAE
jgi:NodT family efflux transporter outer membrane factor (OMF) lipoprotein